MRKGVFKSLCALLSILMVLSVMPAGFVASAEVNMETKDGFLDFEAEDTDYKSGRLEEHSDRNKYSGGKALTIPVEDKTQPDADAEPDIDLSFKADVDGTYSVWVRAYASVADEAGQSVFLAFNGGEYAWTFVDGERDKAAWTKLCTLDVNAGETGDVRLRIRQSVAMALDRFIITNDTSYTPDDIDLGLAEPTPTPTPTPEPTPFQTPSADDVEIKTENGNAVVEIEDLNFDTTRLKKEEGDRYSGGAGVIVTLEDKTTPSENAPAMIDLSFVPDSAGTYNVWLYSYAMQDNSTGNSIFLSVDGKPYSYSVIQGTPDEAGWTKLATLRVDAAGDVQSVRIIPRQMVRIGFDKAIITSNVTFAPHGKDPDPTSSSIAELPSGVYPMPTVFPPAGVHPRLFFTEKDIPTIKANMTAEQNAAALANLNSDLAYEGDGSFGESRNGHNYDGGKIFNAIEARAFDYAINGNTEHGQEAVSMMKNALTTADFAGYQFSVRVWGRMILTASKVYDWCYDIISDEDKTFLTAACSSYAGSLETGYPPSGMGAVCGHGGEGMFLVHLMSFAIATYDEHPDIYNYIGGRLFSEFVPARNYVYQSGAYHQGSAYLRYSNDIICAVMFKQMLGIDIFDTSFQKLIYETIYSRRPDGQVLRKGDDWNEYGQSTSTYWSTYRGALFLGAYYYNDPYLKREYQKTDPLMEANFNDDEGALSTPLKLILNDPNLEGKSNASLPKTFYSAYPTATMIARTGWDDGFESPDVMAYTKIGGRWAANHEHLDAGHFQLYYKGILASDSGYYGAGYGVTHDYNYHKRGVAHNILTIYDPNENMSYYGGVANDGGQRAPNNGSEPQTLDAWLDDEYETGEVTGHESGPNPYDPEYSYMAGDITKAYSDKVSEVLRSTVLLPLDDADHPATFVVFDKVTSTNPSFKKGWLLHMQEEPAVEGNKTIVTRTAGGYNGRMVNETLLPKSVNIEKIGGEGKQFWVDGTNYDYPGISATAAAEVGWGRVEISPTEENETDYFLNVMTVSDADTTAPDLVSTLIEGDNYAGAVIADRVALFAKDKERIENSLTFTIPGSGDYKVFAAGLKAGTWTTNTGASAIVTEEGGVAYFTAPAGEVTLTLSSPEATRNDNFTMEDVETIGIKVKNMFIYSDVPAFLENDRTLVPMRAIFEAIDAEVTYDDATATATATKSGRTVTITENQTTAYVDGQPYELDVPAQIKNDRFVVPVRFVSESFNCKVTWDPFAECVYIVPGIIVDPNAGQAKIVGCKYSAYSGEEIGELTYDNDVETLWSVGDVGEWIYWQFDKEETIKSIYIMLNKATERVAYFDLAYSNDGENWTEIGSFEGNGTTDGEVFELPSPVKAKYIRYTAQGNSTSTWNAIKEIQFNIAE